jgi:formylglycine-generating enzyme required for sulfatase activity
MDCVRRLSSLLAVIAGVGSAGACASLSGLANEPADASADGAGADAADAASDLPVTEGAGGCPFGRGPSMVRVAWGFCIDSTEVTNGQYDAFLAALAAGDAPAVPPRCQWNTAFAQPVHPQCALGAAYPVACVNWCQAYAFCAWAGKRLCGAIDGGSLPSANAVDPGFSAWVTACTANGALAYEYGTVYAPVCNTIAPDGGNSPSSFSPVASLLGCEGPPGVYDLNGNVSEWQDSCALDAGNGQADLCHHLGGSLHDNKRCTADDTDTRDKGYIATYGFGFRCCSP